MSLGSLARYDDAEDEIRDEDHDLVLTKPPVEPMEVDDGKTNTEETETTDPPSPPVEVKPSPTKDPAEVSVKATGLLSLGAYGDMSDDDVEQDMSESEEEEDNPPPKIISNQSIVKPIKKPPQEKKTVVNLGLYNVSSVLTAEHLDVKKDSPATSSPKPIAVSLPPEPEGRCSKSLQEKIANMIEKKKLGNLNMSELIQKKKEFRNPSIYEKLISYIGIDEHGTNFPTSLYDPSIWGPESYYDELAKKQREYHREKEKEKAKKSQIEFVASTKKAAVAQATSSVPEKKSKWDQKAPPPPKILTVPPKLPPSVQAALKNAKP